MGIDNEKELVQHIQTLSAFKELSKLQKEHLMLHMQKKIKSKHIANEGYTQYQALLGKAKSKDDLVEAFALISSDPEAVYNFLQKSALRIAELKKYLADAGLDDSTSTKFLILAFKDVQVKLQQQAGSAKYDCLGVCSSNFNISMSGIEANYNAGLAVCVGAALAGYLGAAASGPLAPAVAIGVGVAELSCIGASYYLYTVNFNNAIDSLDQCALAATANCG